MPRQEDANVGRLFTFVAIAQYPGLEHALVGVEVNIVEGLSQTRLEKLLGGRLTGGLPEAR